MFNYLNADAEHIFFFPIRYNPISRQQLGEEVFAAFYGSHPQPPTPSAATGAAGAHRLALMLMVLAIGSLMDPHLPAYGIEAEKYHRLARAALFQSALEDEPTLHAVQALVGCFGAHCPLYLVY